MMPLAYVALGSNLGDRSQTLASALASIHAIEGCRVVRASRVEETPPIGPEQPAYLNQMALVDAALSPEALLDALQAIENAHGRERTIRWGPRTLDLDIVAFADGTLVATPRLTVPHPELPNRDFWQREMQDIEQQGDARE